MKKTEQFSKDRAVDELVVALKQLDYNCRSVFTRSQHNQKVQEVCHALYEASQSLQEWITLPGSAKIIVVWQPELSDFDTDDEAYSDLD